MVVSSGSGGITFSILTWILVIILSLNEFVSYGAKRNVATEHLTVDTSLDQRVSYCVGLRCEGLDWNKLNYI